MNQRNSGTDERTIRRSLRRARKGAKMAGGENRENRRTARSRSPQYRILRCAIVAYALPHGIRTRRATLPTLIRIAKRTFVARNPRDNAERFSRRPFPARSRAKPDRACASRAKFTSKSIARDGAKTTIIQTIARVSRLGERFSSHYCRINSVLI